MPDFQIPENIDPLTSKLLQGRDLEGKFISAKTQAEGLKRIYLEQTKALAAANAELKKQLSIEQALDKQFKTLKTGIERFYQETNTSFENVTRKVDKLSGAFKTVGKTATDVSHSARSALGGIAAGVSGAISGVTNFVGNSVLSLRNLVESAAVLAALHKLGDYVQDVGFQRGQTQALGGSFRDVNAVLPSRRDAALYNQFATQETGSVARRFSSSTEIAGLTALRSKLAESLGTDQATTLALRITDAFKNSNQELSQFLAMASVDVPKALKQWEAIDIDTFSQGLSAATMQANELTHVATVMEKSWNDVKDSFEQFVTSVVKENGVQLEHIFQDLSGGIVDVINSGRHLAVEFKPVFDVMATGAHWVAKELRQWQELLNPRLLDEQFRQTEQLGREAAELLAEAQDLQKAGLTDAAKKRADEAREVMKKQQQAYKDAISMPDLTLKAAEHVDVLSKNFEKAVQSTVKEKAAIEQVLTPLERASLLIENMKVGQEIQQLNVALGQAQIALGESSPFGFAMAYEARLKTFAQVQKYVDMLQREHDLTEDFTTKGQKRRLELEVQITQEKTKQVMLMHQTIRGYLDAVTAQSIGAGRFEKILFTSEKNLGLALSLGVAKANPLLGNVDRNTPAVHSFRWTANMSQSMAELRRYQAEKAAWWGHQRPQVGAMVPPVPQQQRDIAVSGASRFNTIGGIGAGELRDAAHLILKAVDKMQDTHDTAQAALPVQNRYMPVIR